MISDWSFNQFEWSGVPQVICQLIWIMQSSLNDLLIEKLTNSEFWFDLAGNLKVILQLATHVRLLKSNFTQRIQDSWHLTIKSWER